MLQLSCRFFFEKNFSEEQCANQSFQTCLMSAGESRIRDVRGFGFGLRILQILQKFANFAKFSAFGSDFRMLNMLHFRIRIFRMFYFCVKKLANEKALSNMKKCKAAF